MSLAMFFKNVNCALCILNYALIYSIPLTATSLQVRPMRP